MKTVTDNQKGQLEGNLYEINGYISVYKSTLLLFFKNKQKQTKKQQKRLQVQHWTGKKKPLKYLNCLTTLPRSLRFWLHLQLQTGTDGRGFIASQASILIVQAAL